MQLRSFAVASFVLAAALGCVDQSGRDKTQNQTMGGDGGSSPQGGSAGEATAGTAGTGKGGAGGGNTVGAAAGAGGKAGGAGGGAGAAGTSGTSGSPGGARDAGVPDTSVASDAASPPGKPAIIAAGYGGVRVVSFDEGRTWKNRVVVDPNGGDDANLIRAIGWGDGVWVAAGWKIFTSTDGLKWKEISEANVPGGWYDCVNYANGQFIVKVIRSDYGGQNGDTIVSTDRGVTWKDGPNTIHCTRPEPVMGPGYWVRPANGGIERSTNGSSYQKAYGDPCCSIEALAAGVALEMPAL